MNLVAVHGIRSGCTKSIAYEEVVDDGSPRAVAREHQPALRRVIVLRPGALPKASGGKAQRASCRDKLAGAKLPILDEWRFSGASTAPDNFVTESSDRPGVLERQLLDWLRWALSLAGLAWRTSLTD
jgi:hypothetical protein